MTLTKKAIVLSFLVTIIFSILLFGSAVGIGAKLLRLSGQASDSFNNFYDKLNEVAEEDKIDVPRGFMLIVDEGTFVAGMKEKSSIKVNIFDQECGEWGCQEYSTDHTYDYPKECESKDCLILCKDFEIPSALMGNTQIICKNIRFKQLNYKLKESFSFIRYPQDISSYIITYPSDSNDHTVSVRRMPIKIIKDSENNILIEKSN